MYDLHFFRNNLALIQGASGHRADYDLDAEGFQQLDARRRQCLTEAETAKASRNQATAEIAKARKAGEDTAERQQQVRALAERIAALDEQAVKLDTEFRDLLARVPNMPYAEVPIGKSEHDNVEVRRWGKPRDFDFTPKAHWDIGPELGILDLERAAKVTGARFAVYWGLGAKLERALINFMLDLHTREHGYLEVLPPFLINSASLYGTGQSAEIRQRTCSDAKDTTSGLRRLPKCRSRICFRDETLDEDKLPLSLCAYTPCFRSEAGSYGRDVRGIIRQHQFQKVELVKFTRPDQSAEEHEKLTSHAETVLQKLGLPYRTVVLCTGDMGFSSAKTYDIEVWLPGQNGYKEISSCSNFDAFQARRAQIRFKSGKSPSRISFTPSTAAVWPLARTWVAIVENYQQADGSVLVPEALRPY